MIGLLSENLLLQMTVKLFGIVLDSRVLWNGSPNTHRSSTQVVVTELRSFQSVDLSLFAVRNIRPVPQIAIFWQCLAAKAGKKEPSIPFPVTWRLWCHHFRFRFPVLANMEMQLNWFGILPPSGTRGCASSDTISVSGWLSRRKRARLSMQKERDNLQTDKRVVQIGAHNALLPPTAPNCHPPLQIVEGRSFRDL